ncbi:MAG TPA: hypothetical protein VGF10_09530 [Gaiella sp.]|jgi:hypothetical protein
MTAWLLALVGVALLLLLVGLRARRRAVALEARRVQALDRLAERLDRSLGEVHPPTFPPFEPTAPAAGSAAPLVAERLPGRAALLEAVSAEIDRARAGSTRLTVGLVRVSGPTTGDALVEAVREVTGRRAYAVGPSAAAFTLPGLGRADGLAALARIESRAPSAGHAAEWAPGETPAELVARLLETPPPAKS